MRPFKSRPLKEKIFIAFLAYSILSFFIAVVSFLLFRQMEELENTSGRIGNVFNKTINAIKYGQNFLIYDVNNADFYKTGKSSSLTEQQKLLTDAESTANGLLQSDEVDNFRLRRYFITFQSILDDYQQTFDTITAKIRKKGYGEYGIIGSLKKNSSFLNQYESLPVNPMESLLLYQGELNTQNDSVFYATLKRQEGKLHDALEQNRQLSHEDKQAIRNEFQKYKANFQQIIKLDNETGYKNLSGLSHQLKSAVDVVDAIVNSIEKYSKQRKKQIIKRLQIIMVVIIAFSVSMALLLTLAFKFVMRNG